MINRLIIVFCFTLIIHLIGTLSYAVRLVGIKTGRIAVSFALFNVLVLVSRTANSFQAPLLAKVVERDLAASGLAQPAWIFHGMILAATLGTAAGAFLIPTFQNILARVVSRFQVDRSIPRVIMHGFSKTGVKQIRDHFKRPSKINLEHFKNTRRLPKRLILLNALVISVLTIGSFSALYAAFQNPDLRLTVSTLVPIITGAATVLLVVFIDPFFSLLTDDSLEGKVSLNYFTQCVAWMVASRLAGTLLAQVILYPASKVILWVAKWI